MANYKFIDQLIYPGAASNVDDTAVVTLGTIAKAKDIDTASNYGEVDMIYLKAGATEAVGSGVTYYGDYTTTLSAPDAVGLIAISISVKSANQYGWYVIKGNVPAKVLSGFADNANLYLTSTAGSFDDAVVAGDYVYKAQSISAINTPSTGLAVVHVDNSFVTNGLA